MTPDIQKYKDNPKTAYLAQSFEHLLKQIEETETLAGDDPEMKLLAEDDLKNLNLQRDELLAQMDEILKAEEKEEEPRQRFGFTLTDEGRVG
jgi:hypothetical protein